MNFDPSKLHVVEKKLEKKAAAKFDIKANLETSKFQISERFILDNNLSVNGLTFGKYADGSLILSVQPEEKSLFYKKKGESFKKGAKFKHDVMAKLLSEAGIKTGTLKLTPVHQEADVVYYVVSQDQVMEVSEVEEEDNAQDAVVGSTVSEDDLL